MASVEELVTYFKSHNKIREQQSHSAKVHSVGWSCDGKNLASGSFDKCVCIFSLCPDRLVSPNLKQATGIKFLFLLFIYVRYLKSFRSLNPVNLPKVTLFHHS